MKISDAFLITAEQGEIRPSGLCRTEEADGVTAVFLDGAAKTALDSELGAVIRLQEPRIAGWVADYRHYEFWCRPAFGNDLSDIPNQTQGLIYQTEDGRYGVVLPVVSGQYKCVLKGNPDGGVDARLFSWCEGMKTCNALALVFAEGKNPYELLRRCAETGVRLLNNGCRLREERRYPDVFRYLGWCSWDAFEIRVDDASLIAKCEEFKEKGIPVRWMIIDDMWATVKDFYGAKYKNREEMFELMHASRLTSFEADPKRFPKGLKDCIERINAYGITVGMWHPTTGYWMGIDPDGEIFRQYRDLLIQTENGAYIPTYEQTKAYAFYSAFHDYLRESGAKFVKIDNQSMTRRFYKKYAPVGEVARQFHNAIEASVGQHFDNAMINCMGAASEDMWNRPVSPVSRCSADFQPENREWFSKHILQCSYNSMIQGQFYYCDWDMWWTDDGQAEKNSLLRAISGGPIYISDTIHRSRKELLMKLCMDDGEILMCDKPAMPARDSLFGDPTESGRVFKLQNTANGCGVATVFNLSEQNTPVQGTISPADIEDLAGEEFAVYEHFSGTLTCVAREEQIPLTLSDNDDYRLFIIVPLTDGNGWIGRVDKYISPQTLERRKDGSVAPLTGGRYALVENRTLVFKEYDF